VVDLSVFLSVIVPTRNEGQSLFRLLDRIRVAVPAAEIIIVDGGNDQTDQLVKSLMPHWSHLIYVHHHDDRGKGHAIRTGIQKASRRFVAQIDSDLQFHPEDLVPMLKTLFQDEADFICGSRFLNLSQRGKRSVPGFRSLGNRTISFYASLLMQHPLSDVLAGIKMWKREVTESFYLDSDDFCYEVELPVKAMRCGFRVKDFPVRTDARADGKSSVNVVKTGCLLFKNIPLFKWGSL
jgi:glycosyltransferase involved in cell wall biosynthesis